MADLERVNLVITGHVDHGNFQSHLLSGNRKIYGSRSHVVLTWTNPRPQEETRTMAYR